MGVPDIAALLAQADAARGFPKGTMASVMQQETGGNAKYLQDPSTYHYAPNAEGKRIAGHTGKISTAFGPFGILESTGRDPGYGVKPLQSKDLEEQIRFAGDYLAARSKGAGSLQAGLAGYGEGGKYGQQVMARLGKGSTSLPVMARAVPSQAVQVAELPRMLAQEQTPVPVQQEAVQPVPVIVAQAQVAEPQWDAFQQAMPRQVLPNDLDYGRAAPLQVVSAQPNFSRFKAWGAKA